MLDDFRIEGLTVDTAIEQLVWAHSDGPAEARKVATEYFVRHFRRIRVGTIYNCVPIFSGICVFAPCRTNSC